MTKKYIQGAGGNPSPPQPPQPTRTPDTLHSRQFATFLDLVSEGEIEGFATASKEGLIKGTTAYNNAALKDVFLNNTAVLKSTASSSSPNTLILIFRMLVLHLDLVLLIKHIYLVLKVQNPQQQ